MAGRMEPAPLTEAQMLVLAKLCALADAGEPVTGIGVVERMEQSDCTIYGTLGRLRDKGWIEYDRRAGRKSLLRIVARPAGIAELETYREALFTLPIRHPRDKAGMRDCLTCGDSFPSSGWGNRRCKSCRNHTAECDTSWMRGAAP